MADAGLFVVFISLFFSEVILSMNEVESKSWLYATIIMTMLALVTFFVQHFAVQLFDSAVEISVFYIPAVALTVFCLWRHFKSPH
jgi:hypothetical protein